MRLPEVVEVARRLCDEGKVDYLDLSLWDVFKKPAEDMPDDKLLLEYFTELDRGPVKMGAAGKIYSAADAQRVLDSGLDFAIIGRGAICLSSDGFSAPATDRPRNTSAPAIWSASAWASLSCA